MTLSAQTFGRLKAALTNGAAADEVRDILEAVQALGGTEASLIDGVTAGTCAASKAVTLNSSGDTTLVDGTDFVLGSTTGTKIGTATTQKLGFFNATPVVQPVGANQAALGAVTTEGSNTGIAGAGLSLIGNTTSVDQAANLMNDLAALREDIAAAFTLINQLRADLVTLGVIKGAA